MNSSVPPVSPPLIAAAAARIATITPTIAQNSVVLKACFVSVARRRTAVRLTERSSASVRPTRLVADSMLVPPLEWMVPQARPVSDETAQHGIAGVPRGVSVAGESCDPLGAPFGYPLSANAEPSSTVASRQATGPRGARSLMEA